MQEHRRADCAGVSATMSERIADLEKPRRPSGRTRRQSRSSVTPRFWWAVPGVLPLDAADSSPVVGVEALLADELNGDVLGVGSPAMERVEVAPVRHGNTALPGSREFEAEKPVNGVSEVEHALGELVVTVEVCGIVRDDRRQDGGVVGRGRPIDDVLC